MCKVLIKKVEKVHDPKSGMTNEKPWKLWIFDCAVQVDGSEVVTRTLKTFEESIADKIVNLAAGESMNFEAKKEGEKSPCTYMIRNPKKQGGAGRMPAVQPKSNRQVALECAARGQAQTVSGVLAAADDFLAWLEAGK